MLLVSVVEVLLWGHWFFYWWLFFYPDRGSAKRILVRVVSALINKCVSINAFENRGQMCIEITFFDLGLNYLFCAAFGCCLCGSEHPPWFWFGWGFKLNRHKLNFRLDLRDGFELCWLFRCELFGLRRRHVFLWWHLFGFFVWHIGVLFQFEHERVDLLRLKVVLVNI